jgi:hypothetical protein
MLPDYPNPCMNRIVLGVDSYCYINNKMDWQTNLAKRVVVDNGSHMIRYGLATNQTPAMRSINLVGIDLMNS